MIGVRVVCETLPAATWVVASQYDCERASAISTSASLLYSDLTDTGELRLDLKLAARHENATDRLPRTVDD